MEPPLPCAHPILKAPNTVLAPHLGFETVEAMSEGGYRAAPPRGFPDRSCVAGNLGLVGLVFPRAECIETQLSRVLLQLKQKATISFGSSIS